MFPLWSRKEMKPLANTKKPSQKHQGNHEDSARNPDDSWGGKSGSSGRFCFIEGTSPLASALLSGRTCLRWAENKALGRTHAGMTVEASILLPLFLFVFLNLGCAIEMIRLHGNLQLALWQIGRELSLYGYVLDSGEAPENGAQEDDPWWKDLGGIVFASTYVRNKLVQLAGKDYLEASPLTRGADGLALWESDIFGEGDTMDMVITYSVSPWITIAGFPSFRMANRYYAHIWNGYGLPEEGEGEAQEKLGLCDGKCFGVSFEQGLYASSAIRSGDFGRRDRVGEEPKRQAVSGMRKMCQRGRGRSCLYCGCGGLLS